VVQPFEGVRVVEVGGTLAVAGSTKTLSDFGADVVKVEALDGGELRRLPPFPGDMPHRDRGGYHIGLDTGKRSLVLDIATPSGLEVLLAVAARSDLVVLHLPAKETRRVLDAVESLEGRAPTTLALAVHGIEGPFAERLENDVSLFAWSNRMLRHSFPNEEPLRYGPFVATMQWAATAAAAASAAIWALRHDGERRSIEVAGVEALTGNVDSWYVSWTFTGATTPRAPGPSKAAYPAGYYRCADGYVTFSAQNEPFFSRLCTGIGHPELAKDPRFTDPAQKPQHFDEFFAHVDGYLSTRTRQQVFTELQAHGVMVAPLLDIGEALGDPQAIARGSFVHVEQPGVGTATIPGPPFRVADDWVARPAPAFGEHTSEVLTELGYSPSEQVALFRAGVIG